ncbi:MAG: PD-(D/E)XK nuclease family protein [Bacteroidota bacterium]|nr:PD-(D/E)XK nuclease family protein [Bacteroidota bacterium]
MKPFLEKVAVEFLNTASGQTEKRCIILPNQRSGVFMRKYFSHHIEKNIFLPEIYTMEDFVEKFSGLAIQDNLATFFELYEVHKKIKKNDLETLDEFIGIAQIMLSDFNEIDHHLLNSVKVFEYLKDIKTLEQWEPGKKDLTEFEKRYVEFYSSLAKYHKMLNDALLEKSLAYKGLAYRYFCENMENISLPFDKFWFVGFSALTKSEEFIIDTLKKQGKVELAWDADKYYLENRINEAGDPLRKYFNKWGKPDDFWIEDNYRRKDKKINIYGVPGNVAQVKLAGQFLDDALEQGSLDEANTAIVLADELLLQPLLSSLPEGVLSCNVTMGLPLGNTPLFDLVKAFFDLHMYPYKISRNREAGKNLTGFHYKDVIRVISHPYFFRIFGDSGAESVAGSPVYRINNANKVFYKKRDIESLFEEMGFENFDDYSSLWDDWQNNADKALASLEWLLNTLRKEFSAVHSDNSPSLDLEYVFHFSKSLNIIKKYKKEYRSISSVNIIQKIFTQLVKRLTLSFRGEPLQGIQVMGMLETRLLDFENIILLSVNEDFLPGNSRGNSFIPYDVKKNLNLPLQREKDMVFSYHFYRLIQRAKNVSLIYNSNVGDSSCGEKSRYINQLKYELPKYNKDFIPIEKLVNISPDLSGISQNITIKKTSVVMEDVFRKAKKGFSPSSLNRYRICPLKFYFESILGISEDEEVEETIDARTLGNVVHATLEEIYLPFVNKNVTAVDVKGFLAKYLKIVEQQFRKEYTSNEVSSGKNFVIYNVAKLWVKKFLQMELGFVKELEKQNQSLTIVGVEQKLEKTIVIPETNQEVNFVGFADRVDQIGNKLRIIDYKTGVVNASKLKFADWEKLFTDAEQDKSFQLMMYAWFYKDKIDTVELEPSIITFRNLKNGALTLSPLKEKSISKEIIEQFEENFVLWISEILDTNKPFVQTQKEDNCKFCNFKNTCNRY